MKLVIRPKPHPIESLRGYVLRLTEENGYPTTDYILSTMHGHQFRATVGRLDARPLTTLAMISEEEAARLTLHPGENPRAYVRVQGNIVPAQEVVTAHPKICPKCLAENGFCESFWDLAQAVACPIHKVMLINSCEGCQRPMTWTRAKIKECRCGRDLTKLSTKKAPSALCDLMTTLRHQVYRDEQHAPLPPAMEHLRHLSLQKLCKLLWVMTSTIYKHKNHGTKAYPPKARHHYVEHLERTAQALMDWPTGYQAYLSETYSDRLNNSAEFPNFRSLFNWLLIRLIKCDDGYGRDYSFLLEQTYRFGADYWTRGAMLRSEEDAWMLPENFHWGTMSEATHILDMHMNTLKKMIDAGDIPTRQILRPSGKQVVHLDLEWARRQKKSAHKPVSIRVASKDLGISISVLKKLRGMGIFQDSYRTFPGAMALEDIEMFSTKLKSMTKNKRRVKGSDTITIYEAMRQFDATIDERAHFAKKVMENVDLVVGKCGDGLGNMQILTSTAVEILGNDLAAARTCIQIGEASKRLKCTIAEATSLKKAGYLAEDNSRGRRQFCKSSFEEFDKNYEVLRSIAYRMRVPIKRVYARVDFSLIDHIVVRTTGNYSTVFVRRESVPKAEKLIKAIAE